MKVRLSDLNDITVVTGGNDVGKSNVLKALNLFFNNHTEWQQEPEFYRDFSQKRLKKVRQDTIKGKQFISVKVWFNRPPSYSNSLPERFAVRRRWDRNNTSYSQRDYLQTKSKRGKLPTSVTTARGSLAQFLNKIQFEYVPAVRDRSYFEHLLDRLQGILLSEGSSGDEGIAGTAEDLAEHVDDRIGDLQKEFEEATGIHTELEPPTDIASLFRAFGVSTSGGSIDDVPLKLRGDGIQARYIPSVLNYIAGKSGKLFVWGFEEPENSLEYGRVSELASGFTNTYASNAQIFLTSHSPAFTSLDADNVGLIRVFQDDEDTTSAVAVDRDDEEQREQLREELGLLEIERRIHDKYVELREEFEDREQQLEKINQKLAEYERPAVVVEGRLDRITLEEAWSRLRDDEMPFEIVDADPVGDGGGGGGTRAVRDVIASKFLSDQTVVGLFDRDDAGLSEYEGLPNYFNELSTQDGVKKHQGRPVYAVLLQTNDETEGYADRRNLSMEFLFPDPALNETTPDGHGLRIEPPHASLNLEGEKIEIDREFVEQAAEEDYRHCRRIDGGKTVFAEDVVPSLPDEAFRNFEPTLTLLEDYAG